ncbi:GCR1-dependent translation factor 1 [Nakaseomyces bracarensis]|uniref:GDT1 family protein n=1 Tax=Nakaseomyces bracarensis TaxID=273131 RepID=A0ABR4P103_9SACH
MFKIIASLALVPLVSATTTTTTTNNMPDVSMSHLSSFSMAVAMIGLSEIGDKTFLIAALMAMRHPRLLVFSSAALSLAIMTILSGILGHTFVSFIPERWTTYLAGILFFVFGYKLAMEGLEMSKDAGVEEEMTEVEEEIAISTMNEKMEDMEAGADSKKYKENTSILNQIQATFSKVISPIWVSIFFMVFLGELGDRSQISIIAMATDSDYWYVIAGAVLGHIICTGVAVVGGKLLATKISMRTITLSGALLFFVFGISYVYHAFHL